MTLIGHIKCQAGVSRWAIPQIYSARGRPETGVSAARLSERGGFDLDVLDAAVDSSA
jgi:hypothetical protein